MERTLKSRNQPRPAREPSHRERRGSASPHADRLESLMEGDFRPEEGTLVSFLVNALYLFGGQDIAVYGGIPQGVALELTRQGHRVSPGREGMAGRDRSLFLARAFGRGDDGEILAGLRGMRKTVRPGGLICFHVFDRDRAWSLAGERTFADNVDKARARMGFEPDSGRLTFRLLETGTGGRAPEPRKGGAYAPGYGSALALKAWNLAEIRSLLRSAGLDLERAYGDWEGRGPETGGAETGRLIIVAARPRRNRRRGVSARK